MKPLYKTLLVLSALVPGGLAHAGTSGIFDTDALMQAPEVEWGARDGLIQKIWYSSVPCQGKPTKIFAYVGRPEGAGPFPAMVLVHGGGGTAYNEWAEHWARRGYVAIAMDLRGFGPDHKTRHADAGPEMTNENQLMAADSDDALRDGWTYHAVAAAVRAHSVLLAMPEVDKTRTGITGISWGGYTTCIAVGLDHRFKVAVPVYGCGFLHEDSWLREKIDAMPPAQRERWVRLCDPSAYLPGVACPILFVNASNDLAFYLDSTFRGAALVRPEYRNLSIQIGLKHYHNWTIAEVDAFVKAALKPRFAAPPPRFAAPKTKGRLARAAVTGDLAGAKAYINYADAGSPWKDRQWRTAPAAIEDGAISATVPGDGEAVYYFSIKDRRGLLSSGECGGTEGADIPRLFHPAAEGNGNPPSADNKTENPDPAMKNTKLTKSGAALGLALASAGALFSQQPLLFLDFEEASGNFKNKGSLTLSAEPNNAGDTHGAPGSGIGGSRAWNSDLPGEKQGVGKASLRLTNEADELAAPESFTVAFWYNTSQPLAGGARFLAKQTNDRKGGYSIGAINENTIHLLFGNGASEKLLTARSTDYGLRDIWVFFALTFDSASGQVKFYSATEKSALRLARVHRVSDRIVPASQDLIIGNLFRGGGRGFTGRLDNFRFYDTALTQEQLKALTQGDLKK